uniref:Auxin transport protein-like protein n=1 Tax=Oryza sativa subsp. japonica TaxID=39947 RepID=Q84SL8_ORYSJ|nr:auxin transport protein-like protein [Oryza sativa Japonica Group]
MGAYAVGPGIVGETGTGQYGLSDRLLAARHELHERQEHLAAASSFSLSTLTNSLVVGVPMARAMYGEWAQQLVVAIVWFTLLLFVLEVRKAAIGMYVDGASSSEESSAAPAASKGRHEASAGTAASTPPRSLSSPRRAAPASRRCGALVKVVAPLPPHRSTPPRAAPSSPAGGHRGEGWRTAAIGDKGDERWEGARRAPWSTGERVQERVGRWPLFSISAAAVVAREIKRGDGERGSRRGGVS